MVSTVDFITPPVDDPYWFGQIAAANALSDVYAMGARPITALNLVMFPSRHLDMGFLRAILRGGHDKVAEAGACLAGGHSVDDDEPKYGLSVNGVVHPDRVVTNAGARPGDTLILTKPVGTGVLFNAVRSGKYPVAELERNILPTVGALNGRAMDTARRFELHACTDVTGFGLLGHLVEMAHGCNSRIVLRSRDVPVFPGAPDMYRKGETTGSNKQNRDMVSRHVLEIRRTLTRVEEELLYDPQTSGGLLLAVPGSRGQELIAALHSAGMEEAARIGEVTDEPVGITVS